MHGVKWPVLQHMMMTKKSTMMKTMMEMIMLIMVNKMMLLSIVSPMNFEKWRHIGSPSQLGDGGIHFSCWDRSQSQNKLGFIRSWRVHVGSIGSKDQLI